MATHATPPRQRKFDSPAQEAFLNLWRTYDQLRVHEDTLFSRYELTAQQYNALRVLRGEQPTPVATLALAERLVTHAPDITRLLDKLEQRGLIQRARDAANRRIVQVSITPAGLELLAKLDEPVRQCHQQQLGHLSPEQLQTLVELLHLARAPHESADSSWLPTTAGQAE
jgi:DNA-binding MarR family transcriptional regulator